MFSNDIATLFLLNVDRLNKTEYYQTKTAYILDSSPFSMSKRQKPGWGFQMLFSIPSYLGYSDNLDLSFDDMPFERCTLKLKPDVPKAKEKEFLNELNLVANVFNEKERSNNFDEISKVLDIIFSALISLNMFLCFFSLISSTSANIMDQSKEIGVMRCIGYTKIQIKRIYLYETFVLVFSSSLIGIFIGTFVGWTMTQQEREFILFPLNFYFPYKHLIVTMIVSIICSFVSYQVEIEPSSLARFFASNCSTLCGVIATSPIDVLKTRIQIQMDKGLNEVKYSNLMLSDFFKIWKEEGVRGLYKGCKATIICIPLFHSIYFPIYEKLRIKFSKSMNVDKSSIKVVLMAGGISGFFSNLVTNPIWLIRTRMQAEIFRSIDQNHYELKYRSLWRSIYRVYHNEGFLSLYTGLAASMLNISHVLVYFPIYEKLKVYFKNKYEPSEESLSSKFIFISVVISKICASSVSYPVELIRARQQDSRRHDGIEKGFLKVTRRTYANEGVLAFYSGFTLNLVRILPLNVITFILYEKLSKSFSTLM